MPNPRPSGPRRLLDIVDRVAAAIALVAGWAAAAIMVAITLHILTEIVLRSFFGRSTQLVEEYVAYGLGAMIFLGLGHSLREGSLVRVDLLLGRLRPKTRRLFEIGACLVTIGVMLFLMRFFLFGVQRAYTAGTISMTRAATPMWIPEAIILLGMAIFTLQIGIYLVRIAVGGPLIEEKGRVE